MISGPLTLPPLGVMKMSPLPLFAPCFSTMTAGALARADAPEVAVLQAVPGQDDDRGDRGGARPRVALCPAASPQPGMRRHCLPSRSSALQAVITTIGRYPPRADISSAACSASVFLTRADARGAVTDSERSVPELTRPGAKQEGARKPAVSGSGPDKHALPACARHAPGASRTALAWRSDDDTGRRAPDEPLTALFHPSRVNSPGRVCACDSRRRELHCGSGNAGSGDGRDSWECLTATGLPFGDTADFEAADHGLIDAGDPVVRNEAGQVVWDNDAYAFLDGRVRRHASTRACGGRRSWCAKQGLFEVTDGIYQVRGLDLSNMTHRRGRRPGVIVIDPLISTETAAAALALYREHRGDRPVTGGDLHPQPRRPLRRRARA